MTANDDTDLTLQDLVNHFDAKFQRVDEQFQQVGEQLQTLSSQVQDLTGKTQTMHQDMLAMGKDLYQHKHVSIPHAEQRLDRLEEHEGLPPIPAPVAPV